MEICSMFVVFEGGGQSTVAHGTGVKCDLNLGDSVVQQVLPKLRFRQRQVRGELSF